MAAKSPIAATTESKAMIWLLLFPSPDSNSGGVALDGVTSGVAGEYEDELECLGASSDACSCEISPNHENYAKFRRHIHGESNRSTDNNDDHAVKTV